MKFLKKIAAALAVIALSLCLFTETSNAQYENSISIDAIAFLQRQNLLSGQFEFSAGRSNSLAIRVGYVSDIGGYSATGFGGTYRFFLTDDKPLKGFSIGPSLDLFFFGNPNKTPSSLTVYTFGVDVSYTFQFGHFNLQPNLALRFGAGGDGVPEYIGINPYFQTYVGYAW